MPGPVFRRGDELTLRTDEPDDHEFLRRHWNDPDTRRWFARARPTTESDLVAVRDADDEQAFLPCRDGEPVGFGWLFGIDETAGRAELGYWIVPDERGAGYATETARLLRGYAFDERRLNKLCARILDGNAASRQVLESLGFREEGVLRKHYYVDGEYVDATLFAAFAEERPGE
jgi:RimJ/RimL family protein N-acetyltransferase